MQRTRIARSLVVALTALTMVSSLVASAQELDPGGTFIDDDGNIHEGNIEAIAAEGVTRGCNPPDNTWFCPGEAVTRGQMAAFLTRALDLEPASDEAATLRTTTSSAPPTSSPAARWRRFW